MANTRRSRSRKSPEEWAQALSRLFKQSHLSLSEASQVLVDTYDLRWVDLQYGEADTSFLRVRATAVKGVS
jgi:hypothetical protein